MSRLFRPKAYYRPITVEEAVSVLAKYGEKARPIAGGTDLLVEKPDDVECLVDISRLPLNYIKRDKLTFGVKIGSLTTFRRIEKSPLFNDAKHKVFNILAEAARKIGYVTTRNMATVGGNICNAVPSADFPPVLIALDATVKIFGPNGDRIVPLEEFFLGVRKTVLNCDELLLEVQVPRPAPLSGGAFLKLGRVHVDIALVNVAARVTLGSDEDCKDARIVLGAVSPTPIRTKKAEKLLKGERMKDALIEKVAQTASIEANPISDIRASSNYRREMCKILVKRALIRAYDRARIG